MTVQDTFRQKRAELCYWMDNGKEHFQIRTTCDLCKYPLSFETIDHEQFKTMICDSCKTKIEEMGYKK